MRGWDARFGCGLCALGNSEERDGLNAEGAEVGAQRSQRRGDEATRTWPLRLPAYGVVVPFVLGVEPGLQWGEIVGQGARIYFALACEGFEGVGPWLALAEAEHCIQFFAGAFVSVNRAAIQRALVTGSFAERALKLELVNGRKEIAHVRNVGRHVVLCAGIEVGFAARDGRRDALILLAKFPPRFVVVGGLDLAGENFPAPLVDDQSEGQKRYLFKRLAEEIVGVAGRWRHSVDQADGLQVFRRDGERDGVANGFVEAVVGAATEERRQLVVGALVVIVAKLVVDDAEIFLRNLDAHLDAQVVLLIHVPGAGVADDVPVLRLGEERALPESVRQGRESDRREKVFAVFDHAVGVGLAIDQTFGEVVALRRLGGIHQFVNVIPLLCPGIAKKMRGDRAIWRDDILAVFLGQLAAHVNVKRYIERAKLFPDAVEFASEIVRRHVVLGAPKGADVGVAEFARTGVAKFHHAGVAIAHRRADGMPADPGALQLFWVAAGGEEALDLGDVEAGLGIAVGAPLPFSVVAFERAENPGELFLRFRVIGRGKFRGKLEEQALARQFGRERHVVVTVGKLGVIRGCRVGRFLGFSGDDFRVKRDEVELHPCGARRFQPEFGKFLFRVFDEALGFVRRRSGTLLGAYEARAKCGSQQESYRERTPTGGSYFHSEMSFCSWPKILKQKGVRLPGLFSFGPRR